MAFGFDPDDYSDLTFSMYDHHEKDQPHRLSTRRGHGHHPQGFTPRSHTRETDAETQNVSNRHERYRGNRRNRQGSHISSKRRVRGGHSSDTSFATEDYTRLSEEYSLLQDVRGEGLHSFSTHSFADRQMSDQAYHHTSRDFGGERHQSHIDKELQSSYPGQIRHRSRDRQSSSVYDQLHLKFNGEFDHSQQTDITRGRSRGHRARSQKQYHSGRDKHEIKHESFIKQDGIHQNLHPANGDFSSERDCNDSKKPQGRKGIHSRGNAKNFMPEAQLQSLSQNTPREVFMYAFHNEPIFLNCFKDKKHCEHPIRLKYLIKVLHSLIDSDDNNKFVGTKLAYILSTDEENVFMSGIETLLKKMPVETKGFIKKENNQHLDYIVDIGLKAVKLVPTTVLYSYPVAVIQQTARDLQRCGENILGIVAKIGTLFQLFEDEKDNKVKMQHISKAKRTFGSTGEPPQPFTDLPILPTAEELQILSRDVYLRPNIVSGGYESWEHYLDIQFRLLREDFIRPLRDGIESYLNSGSSRNISDIRVYNNTKILHPVCLFSGMGFEIKFDVSRLGNVKWDHSNRLIFGSLLCLSHDKFTDNIMFATVVNRDPKLLKEGRITIKFEDNSNPFAVDPSTVFEMVESTAYFEAYRYILQRLQKLSKSPDQIPMKNYIVDCDYNKDINVPAFLDLPTSPPVFDLSGIIPIKSSYRSWAQLTFNVTDTTKWPLPENTKLDNSQLEALQAALSREMAVIQGPPGTGKTFIGLKVAEAYLKNRTIWDPKKSSPILIVCFTNHALDQFLEGIKTTSPHTNVIRIGGRSKSEALSECLLREKVQKARTDKSIPRALFDDHKNTRAKIFELQKAIQVSMKNCDAESNNRIVQVSDLCDFISKLHLDQLLYERPTEECKEIEVWLELWFVEESSKSDSEDEFHSQSFKFETGSNDLIEARHGTSVWKDGRIVERGEVPELESESSEEDLIEVRNEARVLEDDRLIDGEELALPGIQFDLKLQKKKNKKKKDNSASTKWNVNQLSEKERKRRIKRGLDNAPFTPGQVAKIRNIWNLSLQQKWKLYVYWMSQYLRDCNSKVNDSVVSYNEACEKYLCAQRQIDCFVARKADVIGMTTTGAAKYHHLLDGLHPKIAIFEEAAEVLEAHLVTSIASSVQQVILIGDHKQLRPKPTCYTLETKFKLGISLFERLVSPEPDSVKDDDRNDQIFGVRRTGPMHCGIEKFRLIGYAKLDSMRYQKNTTMRNGFPYVTLEVQHRMRPEISRLIHPSIYEQLHDASNVQKYENIKGIAKDLFFICHTHKEEENPSGDSKSHVNKFEANYAVQLCLYLLKQGYTPDKITILTMYRGQLLELKSRMKREHFQGVRVAAVDDFQGEENEIIILSLVRSFSADDRIGFLNIENRVCVSLSRAKKGFYIIGNGSLLQRKTETKWPEIIKYLMDNGFYGELELKCQNHQNGTIIKDPDDFKKCPEGGCQQLCNARLQCGHTCQRMCHIKDSKHENVNCQKLCNKLLSCGHYCKSKCYHCKKNRGCKPCMEVVKRKLQCGHIVSVECSATKVSCPMPCDKILPCKHLCPNLCSQLCTTKCTALVEKLFPCGHLNKAECFKEPDAASCSNKCGMKLQCGDICEGTCGGCKQGRLHVQCQKKCGRTLLCGHICNFPCANICPPCNKPCNNFCIHSNCPKKCYEPCKTCTEPCEYNCKHFKCTKPCGQICDRPRCDHPCQKTLACGHPCIGLCGEICPKKCRICHKDEVCEILFGTEEDENARFIQLQDCNHFLEVSGLDHWMKINSTEPSTEEIQFKVCPKCKTPIRKSLRYGNIIKQVLLDIDAIKQKYQSEPDLLQDHFREAMEEVQNLGNIEFAASHFESIKKEIENRYEKPNLFRAHTISFQLSVLPKLLHLENILSETEHDYNDVGKYNVKAAKKDLKDLKDFLLREFLSAQQFDDIKFELRRVSCLIKLLNVYYKVPAQTKAHRVVIAAVLRLNQKVPNIIKVSAEDEKQYEAVIKEISRQYSITGLSASLMTTIVSATGLSKGHWYKCPNGHYYCIGECGRAVESSKCPECKATIGGHGYNLAAGNTHAHEMGT